MRELRAAGHAVVAMAPHDAIADRLRTEGIEFESVPLSGAGVNPIMEMASVLKLVSAFRRRQVELVLGYTPKGNLYSGLGCMALRLPFVPNVSGLGHELTRRSFAAVAARGLYRLTLRRAGRVFFQHAEDMAAFVRMGLVEARRTERLAGSGVDLQRFACPTDSARDGAQTPDAHATVFLLVARMLWDKGVGEFVEAARRIRRTGANVKFELLGFLDVDNPSAISRHQMNEWVAEGLVDYLGTTDDVRPHLSRADCVVLPSSYREGVPRSLLEAAAMGRPVITTNAPGCRDTVVDGATGFLCRPADAGDLTEKLLKFMSLQGHARRAMGLAGRAHVERHFDERIVLRRYLGLVEALAAIKSG